MKPVKVKVLKRAKTILRCGSQVSTIKDGTIDRHTDHKAGWQTAPKQRTLSESNSKARILS